MVTLARTETMAACIAWRRLALDHREDDKHRGGLDIAYG